VSTVLTRSFRFVTSIPNRSFPPPHRPAGLNEAKTLTQKAIDELPVKIEADPTGGSFGKISKKVSPEEKKEKEEETKKAVSAISSQTLSDRGERSLEETKMGEKPRVRRVADSLRPPFSIFRIRRTPRSRKRRRSRRESFCEHFFLTPSISRASTLVWVSRDHVFPLYFVRPSFLPSVYLFISLYNW